MPKIKEELVLIDSNQDIVTGSNEGDMDLDLHGTFIDDFVLEETTSDANINDQNFVSISDLQRRYILFNKQNKIMCVLMHWNCKKDTHPKIDGVTRFCQ